MHKETKFTKITGDVKNEVWQRDKQKCIICGQWLPVNFANSHVIKRSQGGMGIKENIVCHCLDCHAKYDAGDKLVKEKTLEYIKTIYENWNPERVVYKKYGKNKY